jgi:hypothetical protein
MTLNKQLKFGLDWILAHVKPWIECCEANLQKSKAQNECCMHLHSQNSDSDDAILGLNFVKKNRASEKPTLFAFCQA